MYEEESSPRRGWKGKQGADHPGLCERGKKLVSILIVIGKSLEVLNRAKGPCCVHYKRITLAAGLRIDGGEATAE